MVIRVLPVPCPLCPESQLIGRKIANPTHRFKAPSACDATVVKGLAADSFTHLVIPQIGNFLAVHPDLYTGTAHFYPYLVSIHRIGLQSFACGQDAAAIAGGIAVADGCVAL